MQGMYKACHWYNLWDLGAAFNAARCRRQAIIFDLCGMELEGQLDGDLKVPAHCIVCNGTIKLPRPKNAKVSQRSSTVLCSSKLLLLPVSTTKPKCRTASTRMI